MNTEWKNRFAEWEKKLNAYQFALTVIGIDANDRPPYEGAAIRNEHTAFLHGELFSLENDAEMYEIMKGLLADPDLDEVTRRKVQIRYQQAARIHDVPKEVYVEYQRILHASEQAWLECKKNADWPSYAPYLEKLVEAQKELLSYRQDDRHPYDILLDDNEPGWNMERYDAFFAAVRTRLVPLIRRISACPQPPDAFLHKAYSIPRQRAFMQDVLAYLGFTPAWGKLGESEHPLTTWIAENDVRITTKYREHDPAAGILSTVHETGHAYYAHDVDPAYDDSVIVSAISAGMHESQSRLCENHLGRSESFWKVIFPRFKETFLEQLGDVSLTEFMKAVNLVRPSLIRTEADELTYPLHIMIRYEIEKELFAGHVQTKDLASLWNAKYKEYLGLDVPDAASGILQDMHWPYAYFGYFPTYALGSAFAAQFYAAMAEEIDPARLLEEERYPEIMAWLKEHIHRYGCLYPSSEIMEKATGKAFDPRFYLDYLEEKYSRLYDLK